MEFVKKYTKRKIPLSKVNEKLFLTKEPYTWYSLPSINVNLGSGSKLTFIEVLTVNNYKITFLSNIQILTFINISNCEESLWENTIIKLQTQ
jgi:hypothetical protein